MRVLLAHKMPNITGGGDVFFQETSRILRERGHFTFHVCSGDNSKAPPDTRLMTPPRYATGTVLEKLSNLPAAIYDLDKKKQFLEVIETFKPDLVHVFDFHVHLSPAILVAAHEAGIPVVLTCNDYRHICPNYKLFHHNKICFDCKGDRFFKAVTNRCCKNTIGLSIASAAAAYVHQAMGIYGRNVDLFTFSSEFMARTTEDFWKDRPFQWAHLRNPFNSAAYRAEPEYLEYGLFFGRLVEEKGVDRLLEAAARIDGFPIKIIGAGPEEARLREIADERQLTNVEFLGPQWGEGLRKTLSRARFVVVPSVWHENLPYVINEAMASGRPVIASRRGGIPELVEDGVTGLLFDIENPASMAQAMCMLATSPEMAARLGRAGKLRSDRTFNDDNFFASLTTAYQKATHAHTCHRR